MARLAIIHEQLLKALREAQATYASPASSEMLGQALHLTPSYVREQAQVLQALDLIGVRRGRGGGYFLRERVDRVAPRVYRLAANQ